MAYKKFDFSTSSLRACVAKRSEIINAISEISQSINTSVSHAELSASVSSIDSKIKIIESEIKLIQNSPSNYEIASGLFNSIFKEKKMTAQALNALRKLEAEQARLIESWVIYNGQIQYLQKFHDLNVILEKVDRRIASLTNKTESLRNLKNRAAQSDKEKRLLGAEVRRKLSHDNKCPYCGGSLGSDTHADHIYPLSRGGHGVPSNMVMVCSSCNLKKSNLTLREFIIKFKLDRDEIESRLEALGKRF